MKFVLKVDIRQIIHVIYLQLIYKYFEQQKEMNIIRSVIFTSYKTSHRRYSIKTAVLKNLQYSQENNTLGVSF